MGGEEVDTAVAGAGVPTGTEATMTAHMVFGVTAEGMRTVIITMKVIAGGVKARVQEAGDPEVGVLVAGGIVVLLGREVKRGVLKLSSGIGRRKKQIVLAARQILEARIVEQNMSTMTTWTLE